MSTTNKGHGHVTPRPDGVKARCGGPMFCLVCQREQFAAGPLRQKMNTNRVSGGAPAGTPTCASCQHLEARILEIERELILETARLDFIQKHARFYLSKDGNHVWWETVFACPSKGLDLRAAIDNVMQATGAQS